MKKLLSLLLLGAVGYAGYAAMPDLKRYLEMRRM